MNRKIDWKDHLYLAIPFIMMLILYQSSSMTYQEQSLTSTMDVLLKNQPLHDFLSGIEFSYGGKVISVQSEGYLSFVEFFIRKGAHFFTYFIIGFFWLLGLRKRVRHEWLTILLSILLAVGYASFDELRQSFNPGRTALMADVLLDT
ncbi:MAG: VanZ family protein, partial [Atopostipes sp.]|nr:VanZ family protein [Atopostipes sp.]